MPPDPPRRAPKVFLGGVRLEKFLGPAIHPSLTKSWISACNQYNKDKSNSYNNRKKSSHHYSVRLYMDSYSTNMLKSDIIEGHTDHSENLPSSW